jgi:hypothetical protein
MAQGARGHGAWLREWRELQGDLSAVVACVSRLVLSRRPRDLLLAFGSRHGGEAIPVTQFRQGLAALGLPSLLSDGRQGGTLFRPAGTAATEQWQEFKLEHGEHCLELFCLIGRGCEYITLTQLISTVLPLDVHAAVQPGDPHTESGYQQLAPGGSHTDDAVSVQHLGLRPPEAVPDVTDNTQPPVQPAAHPPSESRGDWSWVGGIGVDSALQSTTGFQGSCHTAAHNNIVLQPQAAPIRAESGKAAICTICTWSNSHCGWISPTAGWADAEQYVAKLAAIATLQSTTEAQGSCVEAHNNTDQSDALLVRAPSPLPLHDTTTHLCHRPSHPQGRHLLQPLPYKTLPRSHRVEDAETSLAPTRYPLSTRSPHDPEAEPRTPYAAAPFRTPKLQGPTQSAPTSEWLTKHEAAVRFRAEALFAALDSVRSGRCTR